MQQLKIFKLLINLTVSKFVTSKWIEVNGLSGLLATVIIYQSEKDSRPWGC